MFGLQFENRYIETPDGQYLHSWLFKSHHRPSKGLVTFFHGNAQNLTSHWGSLRHLIEDGYDLIIYDYRGYGLSSGLPRQHFIYQDSFIMLNDSKEIFDRGKYPFFMVYAQSLGGAIAARAVSQWKHSSIINLLVLDSTFLSYQKVAQNLLGRTFFPFSLLGKATPILISDQYAPLHTIQKIKAPTLVIHGTSDQVISYQFGKELYQSLETKKKWMITIPHGHHIDAYTAHGDTYKKKLREIIKLTTYSQK